MKKQNDNNLKERINKTLKEGNRNLSKLELDNLVETVNIYHRELEYQNTELRRIQTELEQSNAHFASLFNDAPVGYVVCNSDLLILQTNHSFCNLTNCDKGTKNLPFTHYVHPESQDDFYLFFRKIKNENATHSIDIKLNAKEKQVPVKLDINLYNDNGQSLYRFTLTDLRLQKEHEAKLVAHKENLRVTLNSIGDGVIATNINGLVTHLNPIAEKLTGWKFDKAVNQPLENVFNIVSVENGKKAENLVTKVLKTGKIVATSNHCKLISGNTKEFHISESAAPIMDINGNVSGVVLVFRDVSEEFLMREKNNRMNLLFRTITNVNKLITEEKDINKLIQKACKNLVDTRGYNGAWILLTDKAGKPTLLAEAGHDNEFKKLKSIFEKGELVHCVGQCLKQKELTIIEKPSDTCHICPLKRNYIDRSAMSISLVHENKLFGTITVSLPSELSKSEDEQLLFKEIADDIGFALHNLEKEENRKQAEEKMLENERQFHRILESLPFSVSIVDYNGTILYLNSKSSDLFGIDVNETVEKKNIISFWVNPDEREKWLKNITLNGIVDATEIQLRTQIGNEIWVLASGIGIQYHDRDCILSAQIDITERKKLLQSIEESEIKHRLMFETAQEGIIIAQDSRLVYFNPIMMEITGYSEAELMNMPFVNLVYDDDKELLMRNYKRRIAGEKIENRYEFRTKRKNGEIRWVSITGAQLVFNGKPATFNFIKDINESKLSEQRLKESEILLRELNATKDKFFSIIAHDLKSPFNSILGFSDLLKEFASSLDVNEIIQYASAIHTTADNTLSLLYNLLEWAQIQKGGMPFSPKPLIMSEVVNQAISAIVDVASQKGIELLNNTPPQIIISADENMIKTLIRNLVSNSIKFTKQNGKVEISAKTNNNEVEVSISDNGVGINKENLTKLFDIGSGFTTRGTGNEKGTGLGLILCKEFVEKHNGRIWAESEEGKGSTFKFILPCT